MNVKRIVNLRLKVYKYKFDVAIDCDFVLYHHYNQEDLPNDKVEIELYNLDKDWGTKLIVCNSINRHSNIDRFSILPYTICHTHVDNDFIVKAIKEWIAKNDKLYSIWYKICKLFNK